MLLRCSGGFCVAPESPTQNPYNRTLSPARRDELAKIRQRQLANAVHYIWETGEDKFAFRYFHTGFWESCEKHNDGETPPLRVPSPPNSCPHYQFSSDSVFQARNVAVL